MRSKTKRKKKYGRLTVRQFLHADKAMGRKYPEAICDCTCGTKGFRCLVQNLRNKRTKSCGCLNQEKQQEFWKGNVTHGMSHSRTYRAWQKVKNDSSWQTFSQFLKDVGDCPEGKRYACKKDPTEPFSSSNFYWGEHPRYYAPNGYYEVNGEYYSESDLSRKFCMGHSTVKKLINQGCDPSELPKHRYRNKTSIKYHAEQAGLTEKQVYRIRHILQLNKKQLLEKLKDKSFVKKVKNGYYENVRLPRLSWDYHIEYNVLLDYMKKNKLNRWQLKDALQNRELVKKLKQGVCK